MTDNDQRSVRKRPHLSSSNSPPASFMLELPTVRCVAPTTGSAHNVLHFVTWFELRVLSAHGNPLADERCQLFDPTGEIIEKKTDKDGIVRFDNLRIVPPHGAYWDDVTKPAVVLPDILEEWLPVPAGDFGKNGGLRDDHRERDGMVRFAPRLETRTDIVVNTLTTEQKLQHFIDAFLDNDACYAAANPDWFDAANRCWSWGRGSVCNQHVNFFLGYMFNYNSSFTKQAVLTAMSVLPLYDSDTHTFRVKITTETKAETKTKLVPVAHRGYREFLTPITGYGAARGTCNVPDPATHPLITNWGKAYLVVEYIRIARYFDYRTGTPTREGRALIEALGAINVYSLSDIGNKQKGKAELVIRAWLKKHRASKANNETDSQIDAKQSKTLWEIVFDLDDDDVVDVELIHRLGNTDSLVHWDHHAGVLMVRAKGGGPLTAETKPEDKELWTFTADSGETSPGPPIKRKRFVDKDLGRRFLHLGIWRLAELNGGFAPAAAAGNAGNISIDQPPRFIRWQ